jgi:hypothetical protein
MTRGFKTPELSQNVQAQTALRQAWDTGVLNPLRFSPGILSWNPPKPNRAAADLLSIEPPDPPRNDRITDQLDEPARDTRAQIYQDVSYFRDPVFEPNTAYEIARFVTAGNETGFVKLCWTYTEVADPGGGLQELDPRDPFAVQRALGPPYGVRWLVRLQQGQFGRQVPAPGTYPLPNVPGYGFYPLANWFDYRFQWGRTQTNVFWLVPQYHALRLYFVLEGAVPSPLLLLIGGRLEGYTQPIDVRVTGWNVAHGF